MREPRAAAPGMVVLVISSAGGGRPDAGLSDHEIHHLVMTGTHEDTVASENRNDWRAIAAFCNVTLMKASLSNDCWSSRVTSGETLGSGLTDRTWWHCGVIFSLGSIV
jgi:hypothetical protein